MALGSIPATNATSDKNSDLRWGNQSLQADEASQAGAANCPGVPMTALVCAYFSGLVINNILLYS